MDRRTKFEIGDLVIHSGSHFNGETLNNKKWGVVVQCCQSQVDFGRWKSVFVHWFENKEENWVSPRSLYLIEDSFEEISEL